MKTYSIDNLTEDQFRLITEALLFSASTSVNAKWYSEDSEVLFNTVLSLREKHPEVLTKNVHILEDEDFYDEYAEKILSYFPELLETVPNL